MSKHLMCCVIIFFIYAVLFVNYLIKFDDSGVQFATAGMV